MNPKLNAYFNKATKWREELKKLRMITLGCQLIEELKWGKPFYTYQDSNVVVLWAFKEHCAIGFCRGALLKDAMGILVKPGENTQAVRKIRFTSLREIVEMEVVLQEYVHEAIKVTQSGLAVNYKTTSQFILPDELKNKLDESPAFKTAFNALTPGRQRGYIIHFAAPKKSETRRSRIEKSLPQIFAGKGLNDDARALAASTKKRLATG